MSIRAADRGEALVLAAHFESSEARLMWIVRLIVSKRPFYLLITGS